VGTHLQHIYRGLELSSRAALIRYVLDGSRRPYVLIDLLESDDHQEARRTFSLYALGVRLRTPSGVSIRSRRTKLDQRARWGP
jgi:hypothetical protein